MGKSWILRALTKFGIGVAKTPLDAVENAIGFAAGAAITAPMKPLQYKLNRTFPYELLTIFELQTLLNRGTIDDAVFNDQLTSMGYNDVQRARLKTLAGQIPSVSDFIRMSVREVFTPATAQLYGQFQDYPSDLDRFAKMAGLDPQYAKYYWAAHWDLPSYTQGIDMYHRGVIDHGELVTLLKSLDVMPYWRDKLIKLAETPYTRVDVRRMYTTGVLSIEEVTKAYMDLGYNREKAEKLTQWTTAEKSQSTKDLSKTEIMAALDDGLMSEDEVVSSLKSMGYDRDEIDTIISLSELKRMRKYVNQYISSLKREYLNNRLDDVRARAELNKLNLSGDTVDEMLASWKLEILPNVKLPTKKELLDWYSQKLIDASTCRTMLSELGYADKWIYLYMQILPEKERM